MEKQLDNTLNKYLDVVQNYNQLFKEDQTISLSERCKNAQLEVKLVSLLSGYDQYKAQVEYKSIIKRTSRKPIECKCKQCKAQCLDTPCLGTPSDIVRLVISGYADKLAKTVWAVRTVLTGEVPIMMVQLIQQDDGSCIMYENGLCKLHTLGLKPTEGKLSHHVIDKRNIGIRKSIAYNVAKTWLSEDNKNLVEILLSIY